MLLMIFRVLLFALMVLALALAASEIAQENGLVALRLQDRIIEIALLDFAILLLILFALVWLALRFGAGLFSAPGLLGRFRQKRRTRYGNRALANAMLAIEERNGKKAVEWARKAEKLLRDPTLTRLVNARAAQLSGDTSRALRYYGALARTQGAEFAGVCGLLENARAAGDEKRIASLTERAAALRPRDVTIQQSLLALRLKRKDWKGARESVARLSAIGALPGDVAERRVAALLTEEARAAQQAGDRNAASELAQQAFRRAPQLTEAAATAIALLGETGQARKARRTALRAWRVGPHPSIAAAYAALEKEEEPRARATRFAALLGSFPNHPESRMTKAELALAAGDPAAAREALEHVPSDSLGARGCALMAAVERSEGGDEATIRAWMARALTASHGLSWRCRACGNAPKRWQAVCDQCSAFDTIAWMERDEPVLDAERRAALAPLLVDRAGEGGDREEAAEAEEKTGTQGSKPGEPTVRPGAARPGAGLKGDTETPDQEDSEKVAPALGKDKPVAIG